MISIQGLKEAFRSVLKGGAFAYCLWTTGLILANYVYWSKFGNDFGVYWRAANQSVDTVYSWSGRFPFPYAPTMLLWTAPLALVQKTAAYVLFVAGSVTALVAVCRSYLPRRAIVLALISPPVARGLFTGQVCAALAALMLWACSTDKRRGAGMAFGVIASIKPQLVLMAPLMLALNRDWRAFFAAGAMFVSTVALSIVIFGPERWPEWVASMDHFHHAVAGTNVIEIGTTPAAVAERFGLPSVPFLIAGSLVGSGLIYFCRNAPPLEKAAAIGIGSIMAAPYALAYDLTVVMPFLALMVFQGRILPIIGIGTGHQPLPLMISAYELLVRTRSKKDRPCDSVPPPSWAEAKPRETPS